MRRIGLICLLGMLAQLARGEVSPQLAEAANPLADGVPEVAVVRLQALLGQNLSAAEWGAVAEKLAEALVASKRPGDALALLADSRLRESPSAKFWRGQALASLRRWSEALPLYNEIASDSRSAFRPGAIFGAAEMLRALERR